MIAYRPPSLDSRKSDEGANFIFIPYIKEVVRICIARYDLEVSHARDASADWIKDPPNS